MKAFVVALSIALLPAAFADLRLNCSLNGEPMYSSITGKYSQDYPINKDFSYDNFSKSRAEFRYEFYISRRQTNYWVRAEVINMDELDGVPYRPGLGLVQSAEYEIEPRFIRNEIMRIYNEGDLLTCLAH